MSTIDAQVAQLYVSLFGRAPDAQGLAYWAGRIESGESLSHIADAMYATTPARAYFPESASANDVIASFYQNVLGRSADTQGLAYWTNRLGEPGETHGTIIAKMIDTVMHYAGTDPAGLASAQLFGNRAAAALFYGENGGSVDNATHVLEGVTADTQSVLSARTLVVDHPSASVDVAGFNSTTLKFDDTGTMQVVGVGGAHLDSIEVTGSGVVAIAGATEGAVMGFGPIVDCDLIEAAGFTGSLYVALGDGATLRGGAGADNLWATSSVHATVDGGAGDDIVQGSASITLVGGEGNDVFAPQGSVVGGFATIADFQRGSDSISLTGMIGPMPVADVPATDVPAAGAAQLPAPYLLEAATWHSAPIVLPAGTTFDHYLDVAAQGDAVQDAAIHWFQYGGDTYVVVDNSSATTFQQNTDYVVKLVGQVDLSTLVYDTHTAVLS